MAAGLGFKDFTTGEVLTAADVDGYLMQGIWVFANATARDAAVTSPQEGNFAFTKDNNSLWYYDGAAWVASGATGDIEGVTAGVGISGGGTSGTVTITNSMATAIDAKGDLVAGTGADTFSKLTVGANDTVLTADSSTSTGLKWAAPAGGGANWTLLNAGGTSLSGSSTVTISGISGKDKIAIFIDTASSGAANGVVQMRFNGSSGQNYNYFGMGSTYRSSYDSFIFRPYQSTNQNIVNIGEFSSNATSYLSGYILITGCNSSGNKIFNLQTGVSPGGGTSNQGYNIGGYWNDSSTISSISIICDNGNFDDGNVRVYTSA